MSLVPSSGSESDESSSSQSSAQIGLSLRSLRKMPTGTPSLSATVGSWIYSTKMVFDELDRNLVNFIRSIYERSPQIAEVGSSRSTSSGGSPTHKSIVLQSAWCVLLLYYSIDDEYTRRVVVVARNVDLKYHILYEIHDTARSGLMGRETTYTLVMCGYWLPKLYRWVSTYVWTARRDKELDPHHTVTRWSLVFLYATVCSDSISMKFVSGLPKDSTELWVLLSCFLAVCSVITDFLGLVSLIEIPTLLGSFGSPSSRC